MLPLPDITEHSFRPFYAEHVPDALPYRSQCETTEQDSGQKSGGAPRCQRAVQTRKGQSPKGWVVRSSLTFLSALVFAQYILYNQKTNQ